MTINANGTTLPITNYIKCATGTVTTLPKNSDQGHITLFAVNGTDWYAISEYNAP